MLFLKVLQIRGEIFTIFSQIISRNFHKRGLLEYFII
jgi:hypothetical protein